MDRVTIVALALLLGVVAAVDADVVELKNGQRVEGTLKHADQTTVTVEVGGQLVSFKADQVRAIYYGSAPSTSAVASVTPANEALKALKALKSVVSSGVAFRDYGPRVADTKIVVDRYLETPASDADNPVRTAVRQALSLYSMALDAWSANVNPRSAGSDRGARIREIGDSPLLRECQAFEDGVANVARSGGGSMTKDAFGRGMLAGGMLLSNVWSCASAQIASAEKAVAAVR